MKTIPEMRVKMVNDGNHKPRKIGRYWASEVGAMLKGYVTPESFFDKKDIDSSGALNILKGMKGEESIHDLFKFNKVSYIENDKIEIQITDDIVLVVKPDFLFPDRVIETKYPITKMDEIPEKYKAQLECEYQAYKLPTYLGIITAPYDVKFYLYKSSARRWNNIQEKLIEFHEAIKKIERSKINQNK